jgi:hypothetical protein
MESYQSRRRAALHPRRMTAFVRCGTEKCMTRSFALWAGSAVVLAVIVAAATVAAFPRGPAAVELPAISVPARPAARPARPPVQLVVNLGRVQVGPTAVAAASRGGAATIVPGALKAHVGQVGFGKTTRATSIGGQSGPNGMAGLAGGGP